MGIDQGRGALALVMAARLLRELEGLRLTAYECAAGVMTIGYGHTRGVKRGQVCTLDQAEAWLRADIMTAGELVAMACRGRLADHERAALISFAFNVGPGVRGERDGFLVTREGESSGVRAALACGDWKAVARELRRWIHAGGVVSEGLERRRDIEARVFLGELNPFEVKL